MLNIFKYSAIFFLCATQQEGMESREGPEGSENLLLFTETALEVCANVAGGQGGVLQCLYRFSPLSLVLDDAFDTSLLSRLFSGGQVFVHEDKWSETRNSAA